VKEAFKMNSTEIDKLWVPGKGFRPSKEILSIIPKEIVEQTFIEEVLERAITRFKEKFVLKPDSWKRKVILRVKTIREIKKHRKYIVKGNPKFGDTCSQYTVLYQGINAFGEETYFCPCSIPGKRGGMKRQVSICTHSGAVMLYRLYTSLLPTHEDEVSEILIRRFHHWNQWFWTKIHLGKLDQFLSQYPKSATLLRLNDFIRRTVMRKRVPDEIFINTLSERASNIEVEGHHAIDTNNCRFTKSIELGLARQQQTKKQRHYCVLEEILKGDPYTLAIEIPIWRIRKDASKNIAGHIDLIQYIHPFLYIWDYKPDSAKNVLGQLHTYKDLLCDLIVVDSRMVKIGWFNQEKEFLIRGLHEVLI